VAVLLLADVACIQKHLQTGLLPSGLELSFSPELLLCHLAGGSHSG